MLDVGFGKYKELFKKRWKVLVLALLPLVTFMFIGLGLRDQKGHVIVLKDDGFHPAGIKIEKGETVTFKNETGKNFWPASDIHPTHEVYSEFDPKRSLNPDEEWSFTFKEAGTWRFHDHINPIYRGTIDVVGKKSLTGGLKDEKKAIKECDIENEQERNRCWINYLQNVVLKDGPEAALDITKRLRGEIPEFAIHCHTFTHSIGEVSYWKYVDDGKLPRTGKTALCGYGFHHGFMQEIGHHDINFLSKAGKLCDYFINEIDYTGFEETISPRDQCYHGVGHGLSFLYAPDYWKDEIKILEKGTEACRKLSDDDIDLNNCIYGLFGGLTGLYTGGHGYKMEISEEPFAVCEVQPEEFREACFDSLVPALWVETENNLDKMVDYFSGVAEPKYLRQAMYNFGDIISPRYVIGEFEDSEVVRTCQSFNYGLNERCIKGFSEGIIRNGFPETAIKQAETFCQLDSLSETEREICFESFTSEAKLAFSEDEYQEICQLLEDKNKKYCD